ncbi:MAG TPA: hypothetical protein VMS17_06815 [Gemmataceae bacterium]|nr:hypothetical protein [Gemmataceae bacterium]
MSRRLLSASVAASVLLLGWLAGRASAEGAWSPFPWETVSYDDPQPPAPANPPATPDQPPQPPGSSSPRPGLTEDVRTPPVPTGAPAGPPFSLTWGGQYRMLPNASNFPFQPATIAGTQQDQWFVNQRMRLWASVNPNDHVEGYIQFQVGGFNWGDNTEFPKTFVGFFSPPGDTLGIELRRGWVAYTDEDWGKARVGILDWHDRFGDTMASSDYEFDVAGVDWTVTVKDLNDLKLIFGAFQLSDLPLITTIASTPGSHTSDLFTVDGDLPIEEKSSIGASAYFLVDHGDYSYPTFAPYGESWDMWFGLRGKTDLGDALPLNGFVLLNTGERTDTGGVTVFRHTGWAGKAEAGPLPIGPGKFSAQALASTGSSHPGVGDDDEFRTLAQTYRDNFGSQGYWSYLYLTSPNGPADVNDLGVSLQNRGFGLMTVQAKYDTPLTCKLTSTEAAGWLSSTARNPTSNACYMGTELAQQFTYDFGGGLKLDTGFAYLFTGDFYRPTPTGPTPHNLYEIFARLQLEF